ncbi:DUF2795 domain-containing protein [Nostocaceae cyanobacterium CENA357]|uniref:DUF2795 domain-containing protein n=1 Tax=Atlanticothrix silvestris CENA357 TaxID=1725252 RepID=A0A8J7HKB8_9CYAN|nr:DUF2795 domain-containing protein [Atlanticothrix silvestris]MBH8554238.1 DUF2795 domain-containing protein [Atlanticothrix silvestris CENA357]
MTKLNPVQLQKNLNQVNYPLSKKSLVKYAEEKGIDEKVLRVLKKLPSQQYETLADVVKLVDEIFITKISLVQLEKNLIAVNYPLSKKDLVKYAEETGVDEKVLRVLKKLPSKQYETLADVDNTINQHA